MNRKTLGIYIHIPFCVQKCLYCDFVSGPANTELKRGYVNQLIKEIECRAEKLCPFETENNALPGSCRAGKDNDEENYIIDTVFIGGGTPSVLDAEWIKEILCKLKEKFIFADNCECSMEINPGTVDADKLYQYREAGINRLSIGLQSCNDNELKALGRIHDYKTFQETYQAARAAGFDNINVDLMSSIPEQTVESFCKSLRKVADLSPEHISVYSLIVEEGTPFADMELKLPEEEEEREIYYKTGQILKEYGYEQYEISNYAKAKYQCRHNIRYWKCKEYIGFGCAAASFLKGVRWKNTESISQYLSADSMFVRGDFFAEKEVLCLQDQYSEFVFMGLRMNEGISRREFETRFKIGFDDLYEEIVKKHLKNGLLLKLDDRIMLTKKGRDVCNMVMSDFLL